MKFYIDSANIDEIAEALEMGVVTGVTTNPTSAAREGVDYHERVMEICGLGPESVSVQVTDDDKMVKQGLGIAALHPSTIVKLPCTEAGIMACAHLGEPALGRILRNLTLCFSVSQALLAAEAGAYIVSPFVARSEDIGRYNLVRDIVAAYKAQGIKTKVLAASLRTPRQVEEAALAGADIATVSPKLLRKLFYHPKTEEGLAKFMEDWHAAQNQAVTVAP